MIYINNEEDLYMNKKIYDKKIEPLLLTIIKRGESVRIPVDDILYIESNMRKLIIHTAEEEYEYNDKMDNVSKLIETEGFVRCHQSYLVRISAVNKIKSDELYVGDAVLKISRRYKQHVKNTLGGIPKDEKAFLSDKIEEISGIITCIEGPYTGKIWKLVPDQEIIIGRNGTKSDIVINLPKISREHLSIIYHNDRELYELMDMSANGTFVGENIRLEKGCRYEVPRGEKIRLGDKVTALRLG